MSWYEKLDKWAADYLPDMEYEKDAPLDRYTSFRIGGPARRMAFPRSGEAAVLLVSHALELGARPFVLGNGTNVLFPDEGVERLVICTRDMACVAAGAVAGEITAECGASLAKIAVFAQKAGLSGLEFAAGIPGTVGGAVCMNAGAYGGEMKDVVTSVTYLDEDLSVRETDDAGFSYRHSRFSDTGCIVLGAEVSLHEDDPDAVRERMRSLAERRRSSQPLDMPSAGSTFKRPAGGYAAALIDEAGLKGCAVGGAQVSEKHAGFVVNRGGASFDDVLRLIEHIQNEVYRVSGIELEPEVKIIRE